MLTLVEVLWWVFFLAMFGACVGSFLNVVIYRIPRDISLRDPVWSFCPGCSARIRWYDNLPVLSYFRLGGRCRDCRMRIAPRYPVVELLGTLVVLLLFDAFFIAHSHAGLGNSLGGITWQLSEDWPIYLAHVILFAALFALSAIDLEHYWVDVRFTSFAIAAGLVLHALWTPQYRDSLWPRPSAVTGVAALAAMVTWLATLAVQRWVYRKERDETSVPPARSDTPQSFYDTLAMRRTASAVRVEASVRQMLLERGSGLRWQGWGFLALAAAALAVLAVALGMVTDQLGHGPQLAPALRWGPGLVLLFLLIVVAGAPPREADDQIMREIEAERVTARKVAGIELLWLLPTILIGIAVLYWGYRGSGGGDACAGLTGWQPRPDWMPVEGLATAAFGFVIGAGIGWLVRLLATFILGREAFGVGDIHMMAAAGCVAGWPVVLIGFMLCSFLALAGWLLTLPLKQNRAIPLGPWLSIAFLIVVLFYDRIIASVPIQNAVHLFTPL